MKRVIIIILFPFSMKNLKSLVLGAFMLGISSVSAETVKLDSLIVNNNDNIQTVVCIPENIADRQARELLTSELEEGWIFDKECWHEVLSESSNIDYCARHNNEYAFGYVYSKDLEGIFAAAEDTLKFRHTHPYGDINKVREALAPLRWGDWRQAWIDQKVDGAAPNDGDIELFIWMQNEYGKVLQEGVLIGQISSEFGVTDFYLTEEGREYFREKSDKQISKFAFHRWKDYMETEVPESDNFVEWINQYTASMNNKYFKVEFRAYSDLSSESLSLRKLLENEKRIYHETYEK